MKHNCWLKPKRENRKMADGSISYNVIFETITFRCITKKLADDLAGAISKGVFSMECICEEKIGDPVYF